MAKLEIRCTDEQKQAWQAAAKRASMSLSDWVKGRLAHTGPPIPANPAQTTPKPSLTGLAGLVGRLPTQQDTTSKALK